MKLLIVEDDRDTAAALTTSLVAQQFTVDTASDGRSALELAEATEYDLIVLDVMLPEKDGIHLCRQLREQNQQEPILLLTAKVDPADRVAGFEAGADDYVTKPYELSELLARIRALLRRGSTVLTKVFCWGGLQLDPNNCEVTYQNKPLHLTPKEYKLLELFLRHPRRIFDRRTLLDRVWSIDEYPGEEAVTTQIRGLRRKLQMAGLNPDPIETLYGLGYRLKPVPEEQGGKGAEGQNCSHEFLASESSTAIDAQAETVAAIQQMWQESQERLQGQLAKLEEAIAHLFTNTLTPEQRQHAHSVAHRLIGSLGAFSIPQAAELARQIECTLKTPATAVQSEEAVQLESLFQQLRQATHQLPTFSVPLPTPAVDKQDTEMERCNEQSVALVPKVKGTAFSRGVLVEYPKGDANSLSNIFSASPYPLALRPYVLFKPNNCHVLLVDDDTELIERMQADAPNWGVHLETATDLTIARHRLQYITPDAIVLDLSFPNTSESGLTLLAQLKRQYPSIPVLVLTGQGDLTKRVEVTHLGANAFLQKPATPTEVFQVVTQLFKRIDAIAAKVLIVDDDPELLSLLQAQLQPWGFQVTTLADPSQFWQLLEATTPDLLLLDICMPGFSGIELCQVVKNDPRWSQLPVLFLSAHADADTLYRALAVGADDYILKPIVEADLIQRILNFKR
ncbi:response regulator [Dendronalium sp. ChiSLP03b]|uniref:response regulator n=1 Tax=Dendronalium sp. ChiSLP03b TaxID=3075381 RepID=UPI002AD2036D|nr:response regulator [Dendronalium sp. ChiSLP03b]MDZ8205479.1 response regulator [Dendronalium sp. ChiSLP03b]